MNYLTANWGYPWFAVLIVALIGVHERGLRSLNRRSTKAHARHRRRRLWFSYWGLVVLALSVSSPLQFWAMEYFWVHMIQHVTVMLAAPALYVAGAPWLPLIHALPVRIRRRILRRIFVRPTRHPLRRLFAFLVSPWVGVIFFNAVMVFWMLPVFFNPIMTRPDLHIGLMLTTFFVSGLLGSFSQFVSGKMAARFGRINTMVFTHLPANAFLILAALMPTAPLAIIFLLLRASLSSMDVPARQSYVMAVVPPEERAAAASVTNVPRSLASAVAPIPAGMMLDATSFGWPLICAGACKIAYDVLLLLQFRAHRPEDETSG